MSDLDRKLRETVAYAYANATAVKARFDAAGVAPDCGRRIAAGRGADVRHVATLDAALAELDDPQRSFTLSADDFAAVNPNTGTAPIRPISSRLP